MKKQAKKHFGQNFLTDKNLLEKIVKEADIKNKKVIEIGPGMGALTQFLVLYASYVTAYEIDESLQKILDTYVKKHQNLTIIYGDFLKNEFNDQKDLCIVANIPYNITSPILFKFLENDAFVSATIMIQKEVANRLLAKPNQKEYNALSLIVKQKTNIKKVMDVKAHMFTPKPKVDSIVVKMDKKTSTLNKEEEKFLISFIKTAFTQKRKTLVNNLSLMFSLPKSEIEETLFSVGIEKNIRAEQLDLEAFIKLSKIFYKKYYENQTNFIKKA